MKQPPDARLTSQLAQDVCVRTASAAVLDGSIATLGSHYVLGLRAKNCTTGDILADEQAQAARKEEVLGALSQIAIRFRTRVGESLATIEKHSMPLEEATTSSLEAWKAFSTASRAYYLGDAETAIPLFKRAVAIDPDFAIAHARLGIHYSNVAEWRLARESTLEGVPFARSGQRCREVLDRYLLRPSGDGQSGTTTADHGVVGADVSAGSGSSRIAGGSGHDQHRQIRVVDCRSRQGARPWS